jgi:2-polyprenyl-6-methoxyphenol hydroxylase-like FAD-dependent oxidoreductase
MAATRTAVVVGAGIGGLATAGALARTGWRVTLLERAERLRGEPTALLLWPGGVRALQALGLGPGLAAISAPAPDRGLRRPDGQWLVNPAGAAGRASAAGQPVLAHAEDLHDALFAGLGDRVEIRTGVTVTRPAAGDRPAVTDGRYTWAADLVVAADGVDSVLRQRVARRSTVVSAGATAWRAVIPWYRAPKLPADLPTDGHTYRPGYQFFSASLGDRGSAGASRRGGRYWRAIVTGAPRPEPAATQLALLRRWFAGWHAPIEELLAATEPDDLVQRELRVVRPSPDRYAVPVGPGALVLLGDAGHAMAEHLGQGGCLALEDAATLVAAVRAAEPGPALHAAVAGYQADRLPRVAEALRRTHRLGATGPLARRAPAQARRRDQAAAVATGWHPPSSPSWSPPV